LLAELPEVEGRVRLQRDKVTVFTPDAQIQDVNMFYADTCIFDILQRKIIARESSGLFPDLRSILISSSLAKKIYGNENPIGRQLKLNEGWTFYVSAVFEDIPENSHIGFDVLMTMPSLRFYMAHFNNLTGELGGKSRFSVYRAGPYENRSWGRSSGYSYILVREGTKIEDLKLKAASLINPEKLPSSFKSAKLNMIFQPITSIHLHSSLSEEIKTNGSVLKVYTCCWLQSSY
jgi:putative ABC transport system permease protein